MKKLLIWIDAIGIICVILFICGCASTKPSFGDIDTVPGPGESVLVFYRAALDFAGQAYVVYVNGEEKFSLKANKSGRLVVPNGVYELYGIVPSPMRNTLRPTKISVNSEELTFETKPGWTQGIYEVYLDFIEKKRTKLK